MLNATNATGSASVQPQTNQPLGTKSLEAAAFAGSDLSTGVSIKTPMHKAVPMLASGMPMPLSSEHSAAGTEALASGLSYFAGGNGAASVFAFMTQCQKMLNKDARMERHAQVASARAENKAKDAKLDLQITQIGELKQEAGERYEHAMDAAAWEMGLGIASGCVAACSVLGSIGVPVVAAIAKYADPVVKLVQGASTKHIAQQKNFGDFQRSQGVQSDQTQKAIFNQERAINKKTEDAAEAKASADDAHDRRKAGLDNLQKLLDILHGLPSINA